MNKHANTGQKNVKNAQKKYFLEILKPIWKYALKWKIHASGATNK